MTICSLLSGTGWLYTAIYNIGTEFCYHKMAEHGAHGAPSAAILSAPLQEKAALPFHLWTSLNPPVEGTRMAKEMGVGRLPEGLNPEMIACARSHLLVLASLSLSLSPAQLLS